MGAGKMCLECGLVKLVDRRVVPEDLPGGDKRFQGVGGGGDYAYRYTVTTTTTTENDSA